MKLQIVMKQNGDLVGFSETERANAKMYEIRTSEKKDLSTSEIVLDDDQMIKEIELPDRCKTLEDKKFNREDMQGL